MSTNNEKSNWLALTGISLASFLGLLDLTIVNTALPDIQNEFNASVSQLQWVMNSLLLTLTASMVILGKLADTYGRRLFLYIGLALFAISAVGAGFAGNIYALILFRFVQGIGIALLYTTPLAIIPSLFPPDQQGKATGILVGVSSFGLALGPAAGGVLVSALGWRWIFFINPPIVLFCFLFCWTTLKESKNNSLAEKMDWVGFGLLFVSVPLFVLGIVESQSLGFMNPWVGGMILVSLVGMGILYRVESRVESPILQFGFLTRRVFLVGLIANFSLAAFYAIDFFLIPLYLHYIRGQYSNEIGYTLLPATMLVALLSPVAGRFVDKKGPMGALVTGLALLCISALIQTQFDAHTPLFLVVAAYVLFGIGWAFILSPSISAAIGSVPADSGGVAAGTIGTFHNFGGALGLAFGTLIFSGAAYSSLYSGIAGMGLHAGDWLAEATSNTDKAVQIITSNTHLDHSTATELFQQFFLHGYSYAMWLLVLLPLVSFCFLLANFKATRRQIAVEKSDIKSVKGVH